MAPDTGNLAPRISHQHRGRGGAGFGATGLAVAFEADGEIFHRRPTMMAVRPVVAGFGDSIGSAVVDRSFNQ